jgi:predicted dehydrogenase
MTTPLIRVGFIGASAAPTAWANTTHIAYLLSPAGRAKYELVALCNSSLESGRAAIAAHNLPASTRVYDSAAELAADPSVDLVVVSVSVTKHYALTQPALEAGKMAFVEWPLGANLSEAEELAKLAKEKGVRTFVGMQGRVDPLIERIRGIVDSGRIGEVLSSSISAVAGSLGEITTERFSYTTESKAGGNLVTIFFGHCEFPSFRRCWWAIH